MCYLTKNLKPTEVNFVIYHANCCDGTGSAFSFYLFNKHRTKKISNVQYHAAFHGSKPPDVTGKNVLICDFSYKREVLFDMIKKANKLLIIDHHISAEKELSEIDETYQIFDMTHSAAYLTWKYFFPNKQVPKLIQYIEDRDIWKKELEYIDEFSAWFFTLPHDFEIYDKYCDDKLLMEMIKTKGIFYKELNDFYIVNASSSIVPKFTKINNKFYFIAYLNATILKSDIGNKIFDIFPNIDFSAIYNINDRNNCTKFSLRSTNKHVDVSTLSSYLGGGGHRNASGVVIKYVTNELKSSICSNNKLYKNLKQIYFDRITILGKKYNIVYMKSCSHQYELSKYLLQTKYINDADVPVQECSAIRLKRNQTQKNIIYHIALIWNHNGRSNMTNYGISFHETVDDDVIDYIEDNVHIDLFNIKNEKKYTLRLKIQTH